MNALLFNSVPISERVFLRFNVDFFNVSNHPGNNVPDSSSGIISLRNSAQEARQMQFTLRLTF